MYLYPYPSYRSFYIHQSILIYLLFLEKRLPSYFLEEQAICTEEKQKRTEKTAMENQLTDLNQCLPKCNIEQLILKSSKWKYLIEKNVHWIWYLLKSGVNHLFLTSHPEIPGSSVTSTPCPNIGFTVIWKYGGSAKHSLTRPINGHCRRNFTPTKTYKKKFIYLCQNSLH